MHLGYANSGNGPVLFEGPPGRARFARAAGLAGVRVVDAPDAGVRQGTGARLFRVMVRSPLPVFRIACGTEWFAEPGGWTGDLIADERADGPGSADYRG